MSKIKNWSRASPSKQPRTTVAMWNHDNRRLYLHVKESSPGAFTGDPSRGDYAVILERGSGEAGDGVAAGADFIPRPNHYSNKTDAIDRAREWAKKHPNP